MKTREEWLLSAIDEIRPRFKSSDLEIPEIRVSIGFPPNGGTKKGARVLGVCFSKESDAERKPQIFINPTIVDVGGECGILATLVHELIHATGIMNHGKDFKRAALRVGLEGKMRSTHASDWLTAELNGIAKKIGPYPGGYLDLRSGILPIKKDKCRIHKCICNEDGYTVRVAKKWLEMGAPICPICKNKMSTPE